MAAVLGTLEVKVPVSSRPRVPYSQQLFGFGLLSQRWLALNDAAENWNDPNEFIDLLCVRACVVLLTTLSENNPRSPEEPKDLLIWGLVTPCELVVGPAKAFKMMALRLFVLE